MKTSTHRSTPLALGTLLTLAVAGLLLVATGAQADPIKDGSLDPHRAGWYSNASRGGPLTCAETCKQKANNALPEYEAAPGSIIRRAFVCKVPKGSEGDVRTFLYGNQFDERPACYTVGTNLGEASYSQRYLCLCVARKVKLQKMKMKQP